MCFTPYLHLFGIALWLIIAVAIWITIVSDVIHLPLN